MSQATPIISGFINTGNNTPTGQRKQVAVDNPYMERDAFITSYEAKGLGLTSASPQYVSGEIQMKLLQASSIVNRFCNRWFDAQTIDETKTSFTVRPYNPQLVIVKLANRPYSQINSIFIQVLKWFIPVQTTGANSYLQDFYDLGYYKIVPMLSNAGNGLGSPIPSEIIDRVPLGVLWTNYTFGYGQPITAQTLDRVQGVAVGRQYQAPMTNRLWAPSQPITVYDSGIALPTSMYAIDYPNGIVLFPSYIPSGAITADFITNESVPSEIKEATSLIAAWLIAQGTENPIGVESLSVQTYSITFGNAKDNATKQRFEMLLSPYAQTMPQFL